MKTTAPRKKLSKFQQVLVGVGLSLFIIYLVGGDSETTESTVLAEPQKTAEVATDELPSYTIAKRDADSKHLKVWIQVGDKMPDEQTCIKLAGKITGATMPVSKNIAVYFTRSGYSPTASVQAYVHFMKNEDRPKFALYGATDERLQEAAKLKYNPGPGNTLILECLEGIMGIKRAIYKKSNGEYFIAFMYPGGETEVEKARKINSGNDSRLAFEKFDESGERFVYKVSENGESLESFNGGNELFDSFKILK